MNGKKREKRLHKRKSRDCSAYSTIFFSSSRLINLVLCQNVTLLHIILCQGFPCFTLYIVALGFLFFILCVLWGCDPLFFFFFFWICKMQMSLWWIIRARMGHAVVIVDAFMTSLQWITLDYFNCIFFCSIVM